MKFCIDKVLKSECGSVKNILVMVVFREAHTSVTSNLFNIEIPICVNHNTKFKIHTNFSFLSYWIGQKYKKVSPNCTQILKLHQYQTCVFTRSAYLDAIKR